MALTKISTAMISQSAAAVDLNVDAGTFYVDTTNNRVGVGGKTDPDTPLHVVGTVTATLFAGSGASLTNIPNSALTNSSITINSTATSLGGSITLTTANIGENTNLYFTNARADARADARIAAADTDDLSEGSSNLYFTNARADARANARITATLIDEDDMSSNSATRLPSQQSVKAYVDAEVAGVVDSAPGALNTLNELAAALGDDSNFSTTVSNNIATKMPLSGGTFTGAITANAGVVVDNITIDANKIATNQASGHSGNFTIDAAGDIILDADGGDILLKDNGTHWASVYTNGTNTYIQNMVNSGDIYLSGKDGSGNGVNALTLDMSDGGAAHFVNDVRIADSQAVRFGNDQDFRISSDGSNTYFVNSVLNQDIYIQGRDSSAVYNMLTMDMSARKSTFGGIVNSPTGFERGDMFITQNEIDVSSGDLLLDVAGDIVLDAGGSDISLQSGGAEYGKFNLSSNNLNIHSSIQNADIVFKGNDGGSTITGLTLDMSEAGAATFNSSISLDNSSHLILERGGEIRSLDTGGSQRTLVRINGSNDLEYGYSGSGAVKFMGGGSYTERMRIHTNANIGINDIAPAGTLTVTGPRILVQRTNDDSSIAFANNATGAPSSHVWAAGLNYSNSNAFTIAHGSGGVPSLESHKMVINTSGNVGIGTDSPGRKLHLKDGQIKFQNTGSGGWAGLDFSMGNGTYDGYMGMLDSDGKFFIDVDSNGNDFVILQNGNVGIGTDSPFAKSHVKNTSWSSGSPYGTVQLIEGNNVNDNNWGHLVITDTTTANGNGGAISFATGASSALNPFAGIKGVSEGTSHGGLAFFTRPSGGTATERMSIQANGVVEVSSASWAEVHLNGSTGGDLIFQDDNVNIGEAYAGVGHGFVLKSHTGHHVTILSGGSGTPRITYQNDGDIIVGTASKLEKPLRNLFTGTSTSVQYVKLYDKPDQQGPEFLHFKLRCFNHSEYSAEVKIKLPVYMGFYSSYGAMQEGQGAQVEIITGGLSGQTNILKEIVIVADMASTSNGPEVWLKIQAPNSTTNIQIAEFVESELITATTSDWTGSAPSNIKQTFPFAVGHHTINQLEIPLTNTGTSSVGIGRNALMHNTGSGSVAVGYRAMAHGSLSGTENTAVGSYALEDNTSGAGNTGIGRESLMNNQSGSENTAVGKLAMAVNTTGAGNTAIGNEALRLGNASQNTAVGFEAGYTLNSNENTAIGYQAMRHPTGTSNTAVGRYAMRGDGNSSGYQNVAIGENSMAYLTSGYQSISIGKNSLLSMTSGYKNVGIGHDAGRRLQQGNENTFVGWGAGSHVVNATENTAVGSYALGSAAGNNNVAVGRYALQACTGTRNTAVGHQSGIAITNGYDNTLLGKNAGSAILAGHSNSLVGAYSGDQITSGTNNCALGDDSLSSVAGGSHNVAIGRAAMQSTGGNVAGCVAVGLDTLEGTTGNYNTAVGYRAGVAITGGAKNTILGAYTGNQDSLDIRTSSNHVILSDGDGNVEFHADRDNSLYTIGDIEEYREKVLFTNNVAYTRDIDILNTTGQGNFIEVLCGYNHYYNTTYGAWRYSLVNYRSSSNNSLITTDDIKNHSSTGGGSWTITLVNNGTQLRITKTAGTYVGAGYGWILVRQIK